MNLSNLFPFEGKGIHMDLQNLALQVNASSVIHPSVSAKALAITSAQLRGTDSCAFTSSCALICCWSRETFEFRPMAYMIHTISSIGMHHVQHVVDV